MAHTPHKHTTHTLTYTEKSFVNTQLSTDLYKLTYSVSHQSTISTSILYTTEKYNSPLLSFHSYAIFNTEIYRDLHKTVSQRVAFPVSRTLFHNSPCMIDMKTCILYINSALVCNE